MSNRSETMRPVSPPGAVSFRRLADADLHFMHRWLTSPDVPKWYAPEPLTLGDVRDEYAPNIAGETATTSYIIQIDGMATGYIFTYRVNYYADYGRHLAHSNNAACLDVFIGNPAFRHKGYGKEILRRFLAEYIFADGVDESWGRSRPSEQGRHSIRRKLDSSM